MQRAVVTITFWNVGSLVKGYEAAKVSITNTSKVSGVSETITGSGTFSGGPYGVFHFTVGGKRVSGQMKGAFRPYYEGHPGITETSGFEGWKDWW